jgi:hypothetical protein
MISKCANPACSAHFLYLHQGKLFRFERETQHPDEILLGFDPAVLKQSNAVDYFWLCQKCSETMTLIHCRGVGVTMHPLHLLLRAAS